MSNESTIKNSFEPLEGTVYAYATFEIGPHNPLPSLTLLGGGQAPLQRFAASPRTWGTTSPITPFGSENASDPSPGGSDRGTVIVTLMGRLRNRVDLLPVVRFGLADGGRRDPGNTQLVPWASNGQIGYYGDHGRPDTRYTMRIRIETALGVMDVHVRAEGEERWFPLAESVPVENHIDAVCKLHVDRSPDAAEIADIHGAKELWLEGERVRPYWFAKANRLVKPDAGFRFQSQCSHWMRGNHVTVARTEANWLGFPDIVQTRSGKLICTYTEGFGHGGGPRVLIQESHDLGRNWGEPREIGSGKCNTSRIQELRDGTLLHIYDLYQGIPVLQTSTDDGKTWTDRCELDPQKAGGLLAIVPGRVLEMNDSSWLLPASSYLPPSNHERIEIYHSPDRGANWKLWSVIEGYPPFSLSEPSLVALPDGRLVCYMREARADGLPGCKAYSSDGGKTWSRLEELPFAVVGRTCAGLLSDGRVLLTFRTATGRPALWAWVGSPDDHTGPRISGAHYEDSASVGLKDNQLHIDNDGGRGQCTIYYLQSPDSQTATIDFTAELRVIANAGCAATIGIPYAGKLRIFPDHLEMAHDPQVRFAIDASQFHVYRVVSGGGYLRIYADGELKLDTDRLAQRRPRSYYQLPWTRNESNPQWMVEPGRDDRFWIYDFCLTFGNEVDPEAPMGPATPAPVWNTQENRLVLIEPTSFFSPQITPRVSGYSVWKRVECLIKEPGGKAHQTSWAAARDGFPDQYQLDHVIEVEATNWGADQGYSGWVEMSNGEILVLNYTDDTALVNQPAGYWGRSWIRGTFLNLADLTPHRATMG